MYKKILYIAVNAVIIVFGVIFVFMGWAMSFEYYDQFPILKSVSPDKSYIAVVFDESYGFNDYRQIYIRKKDENFKVMYNRKISATEVCHFPGHQYVIKLNWLSKNELEVYSNSPSINTDCITNFNGIRVFAKKIVF